MKGRSLRLGFGPIVGEVFRYIAFLDCSQTDTRSRFGGPLVRIVRCLLGGRSLSNFVWLEGEQYGSGRRRASGLGSQQLERVLF